MTITINVVTETPLEGERIRRFKGENPDAVLKEARDYLSWAVPKPVKTAPKKAVAKQAAVKTVPKKAVKSKKR